MVYSEGRQALLRAAESAITENGIEAVTTRDICARAGVRAPTLYHHFGDKDGLLEELLHETYLRYRQVKQELLVTGDPVDDAARGWDAHVDFARRHAALYPLMLRPGYQASAESMASLRSGFDRLNQIGALRAGITPELATVVLSAALRGIAARICRSPDDPTLTQASQVLRDAVISSLIKEGTNR
jgi:AcrR family transcriptional regulator